MMRKVKVAFLVQPATAPPVLASDTSLCADKHKEMEMWTGKEGGFLLVEYKGEKIGIPYANVRSLVWDDAEDFKK